MSDDLSGYTSLVYTLNHVNHFEVIMKSRNDKKLLTVTEIFREYGIKPPLTYHWTRNRKFRILKIGKKILIARADFEDFLKAHSVPGENQ